MNKTIVFFMIVFVFLGCHPLIKGTHYDIPPGKVDPIHGVDPVMVVAEKSDSPIYQLELHDEEDGLVRDGHFRLDTNDIVEDAAKLIRNELQRNHIKNIKVSNGADKTINIRFVGGYWMIVHGFWYNGYTAHFDFEVETGAGYKIQYSVVGGGSTPHNAVGDATTHMAETTLNDPMISNYIRYGETSVDEVVKLEKLKILFDKRLITEEEYWDSKKKILEGLEK